jgi:hypothetical protein
MRLLALILASLAVVGCAGDSSALMSVWNDSGIGGSQPPVGGTGGAGGAGGGDGTVVVAGGVRDLATVQCISTSGGACTFSGAYLTCIKGNCASDLNTCYSRPGTSGAGGVCLEYANCQLKCPCNENKSTCEDDCVQKYALVNNCWGACLSNLLACASAHNCPQTQTCGTGLGTP